MAGHMQASIRVLLRTVSFTPHWISRSGSLMRDSEESQWNYITHDSMHAQHQHDLPLIVAVSNDKSMLMFMTWHKEKWSSYLFIKRDVNKKHKRAPLYWSIMYITLQPMILMHTVQLLIMVYNLFKGKDHPKIKILSSFTHPNTNDESDSRKSHEGGEIYLFFLMWTIPLTSLWCFYNFSVKLIYW